MQVRGVMKYFALAAGLVVLHAALVSAETAAAKNASPPAAKAPPPARDGRHDFDFEAGTWKIPLKQLQHPLTGSTTWICSCAVVVCEGLDESVARTLNEYVPSVVATPAIAPAEFRPRPGGKPPPASVQETLPAPLVVANCCP